MERTDTENNERNGELEAGHERDAALGMDVAGIGDEAVAERADDASEELGGAASAEDSPICEAGEHASREADGRDPDDPEELDSEELERRERIEHEALVAVVKDVRAESADGRLVQPDRWETLGLVPAHLTPEDLEMLVYDRLQAHFAEEAERAAHAAPEPAPVYRTATRAVGIPRAFDPVARAEDEARAAAERAQEAGDEAHGEADAAGTQEHAAAGAGAGMVSGSAASAATAAMPAATSAHGAAVAPGQMDDERRVSAPAAALYDDEDDGAFEPFELTVDGVRGMVQLVDGEPAFVPYAPGEAPREELDLSGIKLLQGRLTYYLYDSTEMTDTFANWAFMAAEQNDAVTLVTLAREESCTYPRPMPADSLKNDPFRFDDARIEAAWQEARESGDYPDVEEAFASNGERYFFSTDHLSRAYAESLAEWASVERYRNV